MVALFSLCFKRRDEREKVGTEPPPRLYCTGNDVPASGRRIAFELIQLSHVSRGSRDSFGLAGVRGHRVAYSGVKNKFNREVRVRGMYVEDGIFVLPLLMKGEMPRSLGIFNNKLRDDCFKPGVKTRILAEPRKDLANCSVCAVNRAPLLAQ